MGTTPVRPRAQRGVVMVITLLALALLLIAATAMLHSSRSTGLNAGQVAVKRDLSNRSERGFAAALAVLNAFSARDANLPASNYFASQLAVNAQGVPMLLVNDSTFTAQGLGSGNDIVEDGMRIRFVIDRLCQNVGGFSASTCQSRADSNVEGGAGLGPSLSPERRPVFRVSVKVSDLQRQTEVFAQMYLSGD